MTQALNLANFANNLNTSGATSNAGLQNSSVNITAGTGLSGGGAVSLGGSVSLANAGVTSVTAGTGISVSASTGGITITNTAPASGGGVTSFIGQTGAVDPTPIGAIGGILRGIYTVNTPASSNLHVNTTRYGVGTTIAGSSLAYDLWSGYSGDQTTGLTGAYGTARAELSSTVAFANSKAFPASGAGVGSQWSVQTYSDSGGASTTVNNGNLTYSTASGSWRSLSGFLVWSSNASCSPAVARWEAATWVRYA